MFCTGNIVIVVDLYGKELCNPGLTGLNEITFIRCVESNYIHLRPISD